jgi:hypothetical protein
MVRSSILVQADRQGGHAMRSACSFHSQRGTTHPHRATGSPRRASERQPAIDPIQPAIFQGKISSMAITHRMALVDAEQAMLKVQFMNLPVNAAIPVKASTISTIPSIRSPKVTR